MKLSEILRASMSAKMAERDALLESATPETFTEDQEQRASALLAEIRDLRRRSDEAAEDEKREAAVAATRAPIQVVNEPNPVYRKDDVSVSFFRDTFMANARGDRQARARLEAAQETRALTTTAGAGGEFAPPLWLIQDFIALARPGRVAADLMNGQTLPGGISSVNLPKVSTGVTTAIQQTNNTAVSNTDLATTSVSSSITTIAGQQVISLQLLEQSGIPFDRVVLQDLALAYAVALDTQVLQGTGANGQLRGLDHGASVGTTTYTTATPKVVDGTTSANSFFNQLVKASNAVYSARYLPATAIIMHPRRWAWCLEALDTASRPLFLQSAGSGWNPLGAANGAPTAQGPQGTIVGLPVYTDPNIVTNLGAATNQDQVFVVRQDDCWLYESAMQSASFDATYANQASVLFRVLGYSAFIPDRYSASVNVIGGTGLVAPTL